MSANPGLIKTYTAEGAVTARRIVTFGTADGLVAQAVNGAAALAGVAERLDVIAGGRIDVVKSDLAEVTYGGTVTAGDPLTADAQGRAVKAAPAAGVNVHIVGWAEISGVLGDCGLVSVAPTRIQG